MPKLFDFNSIIAKHKCDLSPQTVDTLQVNVTKLCNQACLHCHVDASPNRTEQMNKAGIDKCLEILDTHKSINNLDITGGAPELNPHFDYFVTEAKKLNKNVIVRHNLTVTFDGNPQSKEQKKYLPSFFAEHKVEVISSLPYYQEFFTDKQRGKGVFNKSIDSLRLLNQQGYGKEESDLKLHLVYNPVGTYLPAPQQDLERDFKKELKDKYDLSFNKLYIITNMPINRFKEQLERLGSYEDYMNKLVNAFNPAAAEGVMCRTLISVDHNGYIYDCDFNQMLGMTIVNGKTQTIFDFNIEEIQNRKIRFDSHCFGCTAGAGSSCGGATT